MKTTRPVVINTSLAALVLAALVGGHFVVANPFAPSGSASASQLTRIVQRRTVSSSITGSGPIAAVRTGNGSVAKAISTTGPEKLGSGVDSEGQVAARGLSPAA